LPKILETGNFDVFLINFLKKNMSWYRGTAKENHWSVFENISHDCCIFCGGDRTEIARTDFTIMFSTEVYNLV